MGRNAPGKYSRIETGKALRRCFEHPIEGEAVRCAHHVINTGPFELRPAPIQNKRQQENGNNNFSKSSTNTTL